MSKIDLNSSCLIFDIETDSLDVNKAKCKYFGGKSLVSGKTIITTNPLEMKKLLSSHVYLIGYNIKNYDIKVLEKNFGFNFSNNIIIDLYDTVLKRANTIMRLGLPNFKLATILKKLELQEKDVDFDYKILMKDNISQEEEKLIKKYLRNDVEITTKLYYYLEDYFQSFKDYVSKKDLINKTYLTCSSGTFAYKAVCHMAGLKEEYTNKEDMPESVSYEGGYVADPSCESAHNNLYYFDFTSLYPHIYMQHNLYSHDKGNSKKIFKGNNIYKLKGTYNADKLGKIERVIRDLYLLRARYKKEKDPRQYALKIIINTIYGISANPVFKNVYNMNTASDCTLIGRETIKWTRLQFAKAGYKLIFTDTDSVCIQDPYVNEKRVYETVDNIVKELKSQVPFPQETFDLKLEHKLKHIFFFKNKDKNAETKFKKKNYVYITDKDEIKIMGLPIIKSNASKLSKHLLHKYLLSLIKEKGDIKFDKDFLNNLIKTEIEKNISILAIDFKVKPKDEYKLATQLQAQIATYRPFRHLEENSLISNVKHTQQKELGDGVHSMIRNFKFGAGFGKTKYCTLEEAQTLNYYDLDLNTVWKELDPFIKEKNKQNSLFDY